MDGLDGSGLWDIFESTIHFLNLPICCLNQLI
jgi:hypothetical protein